MKKNNKPTISPASNYRRAICVCAGAGAGRCHGYSWPVSWRARKHAPDWRSANNRVPRFELADSPHGVRLKLNWPLLVRTEARFYIRALPQCALSISDAHALRCVSLRFLYPRARHSASSSWLLLLLTRLVSGLIHHVDAWWQLLTSRRMF